MHIRSGKVKKVRQLYQAAVYAFQGCLHEFIMDDVIE